MKYTDLHLRNPNAVNSDFSLQVMTITADTGCTQPVIDVSGTGMGPFTLSITETYDSYAWSSGASDSSIVANPPCSQWYWVTVTSAGPCTETVAVLVDPDIFADGYESGDTAEWSSSVPQGVGRTTRLFFLAEN